MNNATDPVQIADLLVIIVDTNPIQKYLQQNSESLSLVVDSVIPLANAHLLQRAENMIAVISCHHNGSFYLYPTEGKKVPDTQNYDGQFEAFSEVELTVRQNLSELIENAPIVTPIAESLLAGTISLALCYINRLSLEVEPNTKIRPRILIITGSNENSSQYVNFMNVFFTAQKMGCTLDVCALNNSLILLRQGCEITSGQYLHVTNLEPLLQYFLWVFLPEPEIRKKLVLPQLNKVDTRAACFCHRELIEVAFVCSVCLSVFCKFSPICTTCHTIFKAPELIQTAKKKRKL
ncbi:general transcription factor IIH subunit 3 [Teleopsis dalmanni]|uniref:general transcription factor IIH subunit 3 n=1 Tax=Teleopsis dalmanni TaxID=139649 RepID=UPI0018CDC217|nr:general transcription factor IIH subunit 3 [Teleopsis dalmanni]